MSHTSLSSLGIKKGIVRQLQAANINNLDALLFTEERVILQKTKIAPAILKEVIHTIRLAYAATPQRATYLYKDMISKTRALSTGPHSPGLDQLLMGGFYAGELTELVGGPATGKTQLCFSVALDRLARTYDETVAYIDTSNSFSGLRLIQMYRNGFQGKYPDPPKPRRPRYELKDEMDEGKGKEKEKDGGKENMKIDRQLLEQLNIDESDLKDMSELGEAVEVYDEEEEEEEADPMKKAEEREKSILSRIKRFSVYDMQGLLALLQHMKDMLSMHEPYHEKLRLVIIDSLASLVSPILGKHSIGHSMMSSLGFLMKELAKTYGIAFLYTNHLVSGGGSKEGNMSDGPGENATAQPALGSSWASMAHCLVFMDQLKAGKGWGGGSGSGGIFEATVAKCSHMQVNENASENAATKYRFLISDSGIEGLDDFAASAMEGITGEEQGGEEGGEWQDLDGAM